MSTPTPEEIRDAIAADAEHGEVERQIADRRIRKYSLKERADAADRIASKTYSPFRRVGFSSRPY